jgi:hypothetical protein
MGLTIWLYAIYNFAPTFKINNQIMKKQFTLSLGAAILMLAACKDKNPPTPSPPTTDLVVVEGDISTNTTWSADKKYLLKGFVYVTQGATLTIEPGTVIMGDKQSKGTLTITRGSKIDAEGTVDKPIIFTSAIDAGARREGDWGGIILLGKAPINPDGGAAKIEGGLTPTNAAEEKDYVWYGGTEAQDNSGTLKYVRIEFAGIAFTPDNEINGLTLGGVGSGTTISYVQVYRSGDDAFEWFGGTVQCDHLVATSSWDDDFDTDFGYSGKVQFGLALRAKSIADVSGSNGFESDNDGSGSTHTPQTKTVFSNMTIIGPIKGTSASGINANFQNGAQIRRNSSISVVNSIIMGYPVGLYIDDTKGSATSANALSGNLKFAQNIIAGCVTPLKASDATFDIEAWVAGNNNTIFSSTDDVQLTDPYKFSSSIAGGDFVGRPNFLQKSGSPAASGASFSGLIGFQQVSYRGAFDSSNDWTAQWTTWDAENTVY